MKNYIKLFGIIALAAALSFSFTSCKEPEEEAPTEYTVWTFSIAYKASDYKDKDGTEGLKENTFYKGPLTDSEFSQYQSLNEYKRSWTKNSILNWFTDRGFPNSQAGTETDWLISQNHAILYLKIGSDVYFIVK